MAYVTTKLELQLETIAFTGTGGISTNNRASGFHPAFLDTATHTVYLSRFRDGQPAPLHLLDGLPAAVVATRDAAGRPAAVKPGMVSGFVREGQFYTRDQAARWVM